MFGDPINLTPRRNVSRRGVLLPGALRCFRPYSALRPGVFTSQTGGPTSVTHGRSQPFPVPLSLFTKRNRFCSRSGSRRHRPTGTRRAGLERDARRPVGPGPQVRRDMKRTRGNSTVIFAGTSLSAYLCASINEPKDAEVKPSRRPSSESRDERILINRPEVSFGMPESLRHRSPL